MRTPTVVIVVLLATASIPTAAVGSIGTGSAIPASDASTGASGPTGSIDAGGANVSAVSVTYTVHPRPSESAKIRVTANYSLNGRDHFSLTLLDDEERDTRVVESDGFESRHTDYGVDLIWDGVTASPSVTYELARPETYRRGGELADRVGPFVDGGDWQILKERQPVVYTDEVEERIDRTLEVETSRPTVRGTATVFVGTHDRYERRIDGQTIRLVVPASASPHASPAAMFDAVSNASRSLPGQPGSDDVYVFVSAGDRTVAEAIGTDLFVHESHRLDDTDGILIHEYIHTRQRYGLLGERIRWFDEGSAEYLATLLTAYQGRANSHAFRDAVVAADNPEAMNGTLSNPDNWGGPVEYEKGARVVAALDAEIRTVTDGNRTMLDVLARMNHHEGRVTYTDFKDVVAAVAGQRFDEWLDRYTTTSAVPPVPDDVSVYANLRPGADSDGDGVTDRREFARETDPFEASRSYMALAVSLGITAVGACAALLVLSRYG